jgi:hypothetical protein
LRRRELGRQRRRRLIGALASLAGSLLVGAVYLVLADAEVNVLGGADVRRQFDRYGFTIFRPVAPREEVVRKAAQARTQLRQHLVSVLTQGELKLNRDGYDSVWSVGQAAAAIYRDAGATSDDIQLLTPMFDRIFEDDFPLKLNGKPVGWRGDAGLPRVETALWIMLALTHALKRTDGQIDETIRPKYTKYLEIAQEIAEVYYPLRDGGWNVTIEDRREDHSVYSAALALHALLELQSANLCWRKNCERLGIMIRDTSRWITQAYVDETLVKGWRYSSSGEFPPNQDLNLFVYSILGRSSASIPEDIERDALEALSDLRADPRSYDSGASC